MHIPCTYHAHTMRMQRTYLHRQVQQLHSKYSHIVSKAIEIRAITSIPAPPGRGAPPSPRAAWQFSCRRSLRLWGRRRRRRRAARQGVRAQAAKPPPPPREPPPPSHRVSTACARLRARMCEERGYAPCGAGKEQRRCATEKCCRPTEMSSPAGAGAARAGAAAEVSMRQGGEPRRATSLHAAVRAWLSESRSERRHQSACSFVSLV